MNILLISLDGLTKMLTIDGREPPMHWYTYIPPARRGFLVESAFMAPPFESAYRTRSYEYDGETHMHDETSIHCYKEVPEKQK